MSASSEALKVQLPYEGPRATRGAPDGVAGRLRSPSCTLVKIGDRSTASRDALLTEFGKTTLEDRYLLAGESYQDMFARVATAYADDGEHAQRVYDYISKLWFMPSTPVLSNGGSGSGPADQRAS